MSEYKCSKRITAIGRNVIEITRKKNPEHTYWEVVTSIPVEDAKTILVALLKSMKND